MWQLSKKKKKDITTNQSEYSLSEDLASFSADALIRE